MARILTLAEAQALDSRKDGQLKDWAYNALDTTGTREIADVLLPRLRQLVDSEGRIIANSEGVYAFERALQAPALAMMLRGVRMDTTKRQQMVNDLKRELAKDLRGIAKMPGVEDKWDATELETGFCTLEMGKHHKWPRGVPDSPDRRCERCGVPRVKPAAFNPNSSEQAFHLFYDLHGKPPLTNKKGEESTDEDVLERLGKKYPELLPITTAILAVRDKKKQLGSLNARLLDGRYPSSFNVGAAWTGRFSSSKVPFGYGGNLQNVAERHRQAFVPDVGMDMFYSDYMQGESNIVAHVSGDEAYIEAHRVGDVHTFATRLIWPHLAWTGDLKKDKAIAKQNPTWDQAPGHDYRYQAKRIQHGSNFGMSPYGISMVAHIPLPEARKAYESYFYAFPGIKGWQENIAKKIKNHEPIVNPLGRAILLTGRPWDDHTRKQGLSFIPQSTLADIEDIALWRVWYEMDDMEEWLLQLLAQVHDALLGQHPSGKLEVVRHMADLMRIPVPVTDYRGTTRTMTIGVEVAVGKNWGKACSQEEADKGKCRYNPYGMKEIEL